MGGYRPETIQLRAARGRSRVRPHISRVPNGLKGSKHAGLHTMEESFNENPIPQKNM